MPELAKVRGEGGTIYVRFDVKGTLTYIHAEIHQPPPKLAEKLGYPLPLVNHNEARQRAIERYKNIGSK